MEVPRRILLVRLSHLGDCVQALVCHHALHAAFPDARLAWAIQPEFAGLLEGLPGLSEVVPFGRREGWRAWPRLRRRLRAFAPDWSVDAQSNLKSAAVALASGARRRFGLWRGDWREPLGALSLTDPAPPAPPAALHAADRLGHLVRHVTGREDLVPRTDPGLSPAELARGEELWTSRFPAAGRAGAVPVVLQLSSPRDVRSWSAPRWSELSEELCRRGTPVLLLGGPGERELGSRLARELPPHPLRDHWVGQQGLRELAAFYAAAGARGARVVACDSGPMHLAAACGLAVTCLEGPQDAARTGPWSPAARALRHTVVVHERPPTCAPCFQRRCGNAEGPVCMEGIRPERVLAALERAGTA